MSNYLKRYRTDDPVTFWTHAAGTLCLLAAAIWQLALAEYFFMLVSLIGAVLLWLPKAAEALFHMTLSVPLKMTGLGLILFSLLLGEQVNLYYYIPFWDSILHTFSGLIFAAFAGALTLRFCSTENGKLALHPALIAAFTLAFAVFVGLVWEFFEFSCDMFLHTDMQKDTLLDGIYSTFFNSDNHSQLIITDGSIITADGVVHPISGILDIGLYDTMEDLLFNTVGSLIFAVSAGRFLAGKRTWLGKWYLRTSATAHLVYIKEEATPTPQIHTNGDN